MSLQVMKTLNFTQVLQIMQLLKYFLIIYNTHTYANFLMYIGSNNTERASEMQAKYGRTRWLPPEQELFMVLVRLRCGLQGLDIANRFGISQAQ